MLRSNEIITAIERYHIERELFEIFYDLTCQSQQRQVVDLLFEC